MIESECHVPIVLGGQVLVSITLSAAHRTMLQIHKHDGLTVFKLSITSEVKNIKHNLQLLLKTYCRSLFDSGMPPKRGHKQFLTDSGAEKPAVMD